LLVLEGHSSHYCPDTLNLANDNEVIVFTLPPNTTHIMQPLDNEAHWKQVCWDYLSTNPGLVVNRYNFVSLFSKAWDEV